MAYIDLILNLALLVALSVLSVFIDKRWPRDTWPGVLLQGILFGGVAIFGMLRPLVIGPGLIFDGRSIVISLCALFFGHRAAAVTGAMAAAYRLALSGPGVVMGVSVILASAVIGLLARHYLKPEINPPSTSHLFFLGVIVHAAMVALMFTLPGEMALSTIKRLGLPVITLYPLATILAGKILSDQLAGMLSIKALQESEKRYRKLFEDHAAVKLLIDPLTAYIFDANEAAARFYGWTREELKRMKITDINTLSSEEVKRELEKARALKKTYFEFRHRLADGSIRDVNVYSSKIELEGKDFLHSIIHDVTESKQAEKTLELNSSLLAIAGNTAKLGGWRVDLTTNIVTWSNEVADIHEMPRGYSPKVSEGIRFYAPEWQDKITRVFANCAEKGTPYDEEMEIITATGKRIWIRTIGEALRDENGKIVAVQGSFQDITERKRAEEEVKKLTKELEKRVDERTKELQQSQLALLNVVDDLNENTKKLAATNESLEALNRELEAFAYSVSHDLRAPLRSIDGFSAALLEDYTGKLDKTANDYLTRVRRAAQLMGELIDDLLKLSRVSKVEFRPETVNLSELAKEIANKCKKDTGNNTVKIKFENDIMAKGDRTLLQIALNNLIENAFKFSGKQNKPVVEFGVNHKDGESVFFVRDNGTGFDMIYVNKLFAPFQRLHTQDEFPGTGIGLATVQRIIHRHGGKIWAEGAVGKGAAFFFTLPA